MNILFSRDAFSDLMHWSKEDKRIHSRIGELIRDIERDPFRGLGKPEPLKHGYAGFWSRRITEEHRLTYSVEDETIYIASCKYHYSKR